MRLTLLAASAFLLTALSSCRHYVSVTREVELTLPVVAATPIDLDVESRNGGITIEESPGRGDVRIVAQLRAGGSTREQAEQRARDFEIEHSFDANGQLRIRPVAPDRWRSGDSASLRVVVPDAGRTNARTSNGRISVEGVSGSGRLITSNGSVKALGTEGELVIDTSNGSIRVEDHLGPIEADSSNGSITLVLSHDCRDPFEVDTSNGAIRVALGPSWEGTIDGETSNGSIRHYEAGELVNRSRGDLRVRIGEGDTRSYASSSNGSVTIEVN